MILSLDAEYLKLAFHVEALDDPGIFGAAINANRWETFRVILY